MDIDKHPLIPDDYFPSRMKSIYQINDKLERYLSSHRQDVVIDKLLHTVAAAEAATADHAYEKSPRTRIMTISRS